MFLQTGVRIEPTVGWIVQWVRPQIQTPFILYKTEKRTSNEIEFKSQLTFLLPALRNISVWKKTSYPKKEHHCTKREILNIFILYVSTARLKRNPPETNWIICMTFSSFTTQHPKVFNRNIRWAQLCDSTWELITDSCWKWRKDQAF